MAVVKKGLPSRVLRTAVVWLRPIPSLISRTAVVKKGAPPPISRTLVVREVARLLPSRCMSDPKSNLRKAPATEPDPRPSMKISAETRAALDRLAEQLKADSLDDLIGFLARHFASANHLSRFADLKEFSLMLDRLNAVLLFLATANLELGQHLRRLEAGHYRRLAQNADDLVALHDRVMAMKTSSSEARPR